MFEVSAPLSVALILTAIVGALIGWLLFPRPHRYHDQRTDRSNAMDGTADDMKGPRRGSRRRLHGQRRPQVSVSVHLLTRLNRMTVSRGLRGGHTRRARASTRRYVAATRQRGTPNVRMSRLRSSPQT